MGSLRVLRAHAPTWVVLAVIATVFVAQAMSSSANSARFATAPAEHFSVGAGIYDITGPAAEEGMMGYANLKQTTAGVHFRLRSRAYVFDSGDARVVFVNVDLCMVMQAVKLLVVERLRTMYGNLYTDKNVLITGIHTHSGPGGFSWYALYNIAALGYSKQNTDAVVNGIVQSIVHAHNSVRPSRLFINSGKLYNSNINRSPSSYLENPASERAMYPDGDTDKDMYVLKITDLAGADVGMLSWFAVHCTSMHNTNHFISGDNKGVASYLVEKTFNGQDTLPGQGPFIAAFVQSNAGDVSPNTRGAFCPDGTPCDREKSTCGGDSTKCQAEGPGKTDFESTYIIGSNQAQRALELYKTATEELHPSMGLDFRHSYVDMSKLRVDPTWTGQPQNATTCRPAMGYSFAAGTTDGCGVNWFYQHETDRSAFWDFVSGFIKKPTAEQIACQHPKPILLDVGEIEPIPWVPVVVPVQILRIGQLVLLALPAEPTTMSGRRLRATVRSVFEANGFRNMQYVIAGLSNTYSSYITTFEEFQAQRYEAASTLFGPHTLAGYQQEMHRLASDMVSGRPSLDGPTPADLRNHTISFIPPVIVDEHPLGKKFGDVHKDVAPGQAFKAGTTVEVQFWGANPRNDLGIESTFLTVERLDGQSWRVVRTDGDWSTKYHWKREYVAMSLITITWDIEPQTQPGTYRLRYFGASKSLTGQITPFTGTSSQFQVA